MSIERNERFLGEQRAIRFDSEFGADGTAEGINRIGGGIHQRILDIKKGNSDSGLFSRDAYNVIGGQIGELMRNGIVPVIITPENPFGEPLYGFDPSEVEMRRLLDGGAISAHTVNRPSGQIKLIKTDPRFKFSFGNFLKPLPPEQIHEMAANNQLGFQALRSSHMSIARFTDGRWSENYTVPTAEVGAPPLEQVLHYGAALFEGVENRRCPDGKVRGFRWKDNWTRMNKGARRLLMPEVPFEIWEQGMADGLRANKKYIPAAGMGRAYGRPNLYDSKEKMQVGPSGGVTLCTSIVPIGSATAYFNKPGQKRFAVAVNRGRALPNRGDVKAAGLYALTEAEIKAAHDAGFDGLVYCDASGKYMSETYASSIVGRKGNTLVFLDLDDGDVLDSITADTAFQVAGDKGFDVTRQRTKLSEINQFDELMAVGTGAAFTPIHKADFVYFDENGRIHKVDKKIMEFDGGKNGDGLGAAGKELADYIDSIKNGEVEKYRHWLTEVDGI